MAEKTLTVRWKGDITDVERKAALIEEVVRKTGGKLQQVDGGNGSSLFSSLTSAFQTFSPKAAQAVGQVETLAGKFSGLAAGGQEAAAGMGVAGTAATAGAVLAVAAAGALTSFAVKGAQDFVKLAGEARQVQRSLGGTTEDASRLAAVARTLGVPIEALTGGLGKMAVAVATNSDKLADEGVQVAKTADGHTDMVETLLRVGDAYKATEDPAKRAELARDAFGKGWQSMAPILGASRAQIAALGEEAAKHHEIVSDKDAADAKAYNVALREMHQAVTGVAMELGKGLIPFIADLATGVTKGIEEIDHFINRFKWLGSAIGILVKTGLGPISVLADWGHKARETASDNQKLAESAEETGRAAALEAQGAAEAEDMLGQLRSAILGSVTAHEQLQRATERVGDAEDNLKDKRQALAALQAKAVVDEEKVARAREEVTAATTRISDAEEHLADVERKAGEIRDKSGDYGKELADANEQVRKASVRLGDAQQNLGDIQERLNQIQARGGEYARDLAHAEQSVERAERGRVDAAQRLADAQRALADAAATGDSDEMVRQQNAIIDAQLGIKDAEQGAADSRDQLKKLTDQATPGTAAYEKNQRDLRDAQEQVRDAEHSVADAQDRLNDVTARAIPGTQQYAAVQRDLRDAHQQVTDAQQQAREAGDRLADAELGDTNRARDLDTAKRAVRDAERQLRDARDEGRDAVLRSLDADEKKKKAINDQALAIGNLRDQIDELVKKYPMFAAAFTGAAGELPAAPSTDFSGVGLGSIDQPYPGVSVTVHVQGSVVTQQDLVDGVIEGLQQTDRRAGGGILRMV